MPSPIWIGSFKVKTLLDNCLKDSQEWPPSANGVYVVSLRHWKKEPDIKSKVIYVGGNTGKSKRFVTRIGDLIADMFGFNGGGTGHHSGGQSIYEFCKKEGTNPLNLYIGWKKYLIDPTSNSSNSRNCVRCQEYFIYKEFKNGLNGKLLLNKYTPSKCRSHNR